MWTYNYSTPPYEQKDVNNELYHFGVLGMKWGVRKKKFTSTGIKSAIAKRQNAKVDAGFNNWQENVKKRDTAISLGKKATQARMSYENNRSNKDLKKAYKTANKEYKKALGQNTTYRKGVVRQEVGRDSARKYLSAAKQTQKLLAKNPGDRQLKKKYDSLMSQHAVERAKARKAKEVGQKRSRRIASAKRGMTIAAKTAATTAVLAGGTYAVNKYLNNHNVTLNGKRVTLGRQTLSSVVDMAKKAKRAMGYVY